MQRKFGILILFIFFFLLISITQAFAFSIRTGYYVGSGVARSITGLGITPDLVIIKADTNAGRAVWRSSAMTGDSTAYFENATVNEAGLIRTLDANGFSLGTNATVNSPNVRYVWTAFSGSGDGTFKVGSYSGSGIDNRNITGIGFQPNLVWVKGDLTTTNAQGVWYSSAMGADSAHYFSTSTFIADAIQSFQPDGFQIGTRSEANSSGTTYYYVAFKESAGSVKVGTYTGDGITDNRSIPGIGFKSDFMWVKRSGASQAVLRSIDHYGDESANFTLAANAVDCIQAFENDGFQIGLNATVNTAANAYYYFCVKGVPVPSPSGGFKMRSGSYPGNGSSRSITSLGFRPDLVLIKGDNAQQAVFSSNMTAPYSSAYLASATANISDGIAIDSDGFTVNGNATVNSSVASPTYRWMAFYGTGSTNFYSGAYTGNGIDNRSITGIGFQPDLVVVKRSGASLGVFKTSSASMAGDLSAYFSAAADPGADRIQALEADGFQIGINANAETNTLGQLYYYFAFKSTAGQFGVSDYSGDGVDNRSISGLGFRPGLVWVKQPGAVAGVLRSYNLSGDTTQYFPNLVNAIDKIQALEANGFQVGQGAEVNTGNPTFPTYRYMAWKASSTQLGYSVQPSSTTAGSTVAPSIQVAVKDANNNTDTTDNSTVVTIAIGTNPGGGTLSGTISRTVSSGIATFNDLSIEKVGTGYTLVASSTGLSSATSSTFNITPSAANKLGYTVQPSQVQAGATITPAVNVAVQDQFGNTITTDNATSITIAIQANPGGGTLSGTLTRTVSSGIATFNDLSINNTGVGYTLRATGGGYTLIDSQAFNVIPASAAKLRIVSGSQPTNTQAGASISTVQVEVLDASNNRVTTDNSTSITFSILINPSGGTLSGTVTKTVALGVTSFDNLSIDKAGVGYTLQASAGILTVATSNAFNINPAAANKLAFSVQPSSSAAGSTIAPAVSVLVQDQFGNTETSDNTTSVTIAIQNNTGGGILSGTSTKIVTSGVVNFDNLSIDKIGTSYTFIVSAVGLSAAASNTFNITLAPANKLAFYVQPAQTVAGEIIAPDVKVAVQDQLGNIINTDNTTVVTIAIQNNPGGGTISGTLTKTASAGLATFDNLSINKTGSGYTLVASAMGLSPGVSSLFNITATSGNKLSFIVQPSQTIAGENIGPAVNVAVQDSFGNTVTSDNTTQVTIALQNNPGGGTLSGTLTRTVVSGVATFTNLAIQKTGNGYTLRSSATGFLNATSDAFNINPAPADNLVYTVQPSNTQAGVIISPELKVALRDRFGNLLTSDNSTNVTIAIKNNPGGGTLFGTKTIPVSAGLATFNNLRINKKGNGYNLESTATGLLPATSDAFEIIGDAAPPAIVSVFPSREAKNAAVNTQVIITFNQVMDQPTVANAFSLKPVMDNTGITIEAAVLTGSTSWDATGTVFYFSPAYSLNKGYSYLASLETTAMNTDLIPIALPESWTFTVLYDHARSNTFYSVDHKVRVSTGTGTLPFDSYIQINRDPRNNPTVVDPAKITLAINKALAEGNPLHYPIQSTITEFNLYDASGTRVSTPLAEAAIIAVYYNDADNDGIVDGTNPAIQARNLLLYRLDENNGLWVRVPGSAVNTVDKYVYAPVSGFSVYTIMSTPALSLSNAYAFPNPFKPSAGHTTVTFTNLAAQCTIKVYTLTGELIKVIQETDGDGQNTWNVKNEAGENLTSGLYLFVIKSADDTKTGKLVVIR